jgi:hypothetical protein
VARLVTTSFSTQRLSAAVATNGEGQNTLTAGTAPTINTANARTDGACIAVTVGTSVFRVNTIGGVLGRTYYVRTYFRASTPVQTAVRQVLRVATAADAMVGSVILNTDGKLYATDRLGASIGAPSAAALVADQWYCVELAIRPDTASTGQITLRVDETVSATSSNRDLGTAAVDRVDLGINSATAPTGTFYYDDFAINDDQGSNETSYPGSGHIVLLKPTATSVAGAWRKPGNVATNLHTAVDNIPPVGIAHTTAAGGGGVNTEKQVYNITNGGINQNLDIEVQSYDEAYAAGGGIKVIQALWRAGANNALMSGTGTIVSNPAQGATDSLDFYSGAIAGTDPTGWITRRGSVLYSPTVTKSTRPVLRATKTQGSTNAALLGLVGIYAEYAVPLQKAGSDSATASEAQTLSSSPGTTPADSATASETVSGAATADATDSATLTEAAALTRLYEASDSATLTEGQLVTEDTGQDVDDADSATATDAAAVAGAAAPTDSATLTEAAALERASTATDSATASESASAGASPAASDSGSLTDASALERSSTGTDSATLTDAAALERASTATDSASATEASAIERASTATDSATLTESQSLTSTDSIADSDSATLAEDEDLITGQLAEDADSATLTDSAALAPSPAASETATASDAASTAASTAATDALTLIENVALTIVEEVASSDAGTAAEQAALAVAQAVDDAILLTEGTTLETTGSTVVNAADAGTLDEGASIEVSTVFVPRGQPTGGAVFGGSARGAAQPATRTAGTPSERALGAAEAAGNLVGGMSDRSNTGGRQEPAQTGGGA